MQLAASAFPKYLVGYLNPSSPPYPVTFTYTGGAGGTLEPAQLLNTFTVNQMPHNLLKGINALDNSFPYADTLGPTSAEDHPQLLWGSCTELSVTFSATMYILWTSSALGSIPIPIEQLPWSWTCDVKYNPDGTIAGHPTVVPAQTTEFEGTSYMGNAGVLNWSITQ